MLLKFGSITESSIVMSGNDFKAHLVFWRLVQIRHRPVCTRLKETETSGGGGDREINIQSITPSMVKGG